MRVLVISDTHSNLEALEAVLADAASADRVSADTKSGDARGFDVIWSLGDIVGLWAQPE